MSNSHVTPLYRTRFGLRVINTALTLYCFELELNARNQKLIYKRRLRASRAWLRLFTGTRPVGRITACRLVAQRQPHHRPGAEIDQSMQRNRRPE